MLHKYGVSSTQKEIRNKKPPPSRQRQTNFRSWGPGHLGHFKVRHAEPLTKQGHRRRFPQAPNLPPFPLPAPVCVIPPPSDLFHSIIPPRPYSCCLPFPIPHPSYRDWSVAPLAFIPSPSLRSIRIPLPSALMLHVISHHILHWVTYIPFVGGTEGFIDYSFRFGHYSLPQIG